MSNIGQKERILVAEDNKPFHKILNAVLEDRFALDFAVTGDEVLEKLKAHDYCLVLLDVVLPDVDGYQLCAQMRSQQKTKDTPIIFITSKSTEADKIKGFSLGGDDYLIKPFSPAELSARVEALLRRTRSSHVNNDKLIVKGNIEINMTSQRAFLISQNEKTEIPLTTVEFKLLHYFLLHEDFMLSRQKIIDDIWGNETHITERTVDTHVSKIRKKLGTSGATIQSVHGAGYRFIRDRSK